MEKTIALRLNQVVNLLANKIKVYLDLCRTPSEQLFLLNYFEAIVDSQTAKWFDYSSEEKDGPYFSYESD